MLKVYVRPLACIIGLFPIAVSSLVHAEERRAGVRIAPWEIEPTEETKRRIGDVRFYMGSDPQITASVRSGELRWIPQKRLPLSIEVTDATIVAATWDATRHGILLHGVKPSITTMTVTYPATLREGDVEIIRYLVRVHLD